MDYSKVVDITEFDEDSIQQILKNIFPQKDINDVEAFKPIPKEPTKPLPTIEPSQAIQDFAPTSDPIPKPNKAAVARKLAPLRTYTGRLPPIQKFLLRGKNKIKSLPSNLKNSTSQENDDSVPTYNRKLSINSDDNVSEKPNTVILHNNFFVTVPSSLAKEAILKEKNHKKMFCISIIILLLIIIGILTGVLIMFLKQTTPIWTVTPVPIYSLEQNIPMKQVLLKGYKDVFNTSTSNMASILLSDLININKSCSINSIICLGKAKNGSDSLLIISCGNCWSIIQYTSFNKPQQINGAYWYLTPDISFGFLSNTSTQAQSDCELIKENSFLCWNLVNDDNLTSKQRMKRSLDNNIESNSTSYIKYMYLYNEESTTIATALETTNQLSYSIANNVVAKTTVYISETTDSVTIESLASSTIFRNSTSVPLTIEKTAPIISPITSREILETTTLMSSSTSSILNASTVVTQTTVEITSFKTETNMLENTTNTSTEQIQTSTQIPIKVTLISSIETTDSSTSESFITKTMFTKEITAASDKLTTFIPSIGVTSMTSFYLADNKSTIEMTTIALTPELISHHSISTDQTTTNSSTTFNATENDFTIELTVTNIGTTLASYTSFLTTTDEATAFDSTKEITTLFAETTAEPFISETMFTKDITTANDKLTTFITETAATITKPISSTEILKTTTLNQHSSTTSLMSSSISIINASTKVTQTTVEMTSFKTESKMSTDTSTHKSTQIPIEATSIETDIETTDSSTSKTFITEINVTTGWTSAGDELGNSSKTTDFSTLSSSDSSSTTSESISMLITDSTINIVTTTTVNSEISTHLIDNGSDTSTKFTNIITTTSTTSIDETSISSPVDNKSTAEITTELTSHSVLTDETATISTTPNTSETEKKTVNDTQTTMSDYSVTNSLETTSKSFENDQLECFFYNLKETKRSCPIISTRNCNLKDNVKTTRSPVITQKKFFLVDCNNGEKSDYLTGNELMSSLNNTIIFENCNRKSSIYMSGLKKVCNSVIMQVNPFTLTTAETTTSDTTFNATENENTTELTRTNFETADEATTFDTTLERTTLYGGLSTELLKITSNVPLNTTLQIIMLTTSTISFSNADTKLNSFISTTSGPETTSKNLENYQLACFFYDIKRAKRPGKDSCPVINYKNCNLEDSRKPSRIPVMNKVKYYLVNCNNGEKREYLTVNDLNSALNNSIIFEKCNGQSLINLIGLKKACDSVMIQKA